MSGDVEKAGWVSSRALWAIAAAAVVAFYFFGLTIPLVGPDEPRYAQVAREMFERSDWITPTLGGSHWFEKPPLLYWLQASAYHVFGVGEFAARAGSALFGLGTIAALWMLGREAAKRFGDQNQINFANLLATIAASTLGLIVFARGASFDIILTFPMTASLVAFYVAHSRLTLGSPANLPLFLFYFFAGLSLLAKGLIGVVFPYAVVFVFYVVSRRFPPRVVWWSVFWGSVVAISVGMIWYLPMYLRHGYEFVDEFFIQHHFARYTSNKYAHPGPFYYYLGVLPLMTLPWLPFFFAGVYRAVRAFFARDEMGSESTNLRMKSDVVLFALVWLAVPLVFFSISGSKLPGYILPAIPAAAVITSVYIEGWRSVSPRRANVVLAIAAATIVLVAGTAATIAPRFAEADSVKGMFAAAEARGLGDDTVLSLHTLPHNAEFYAAGRLVRDADGKLKKFLGPLEVLDFLDKNGRERLLVIVPKEYLKDAVGTPHFRGEVIGENAELVLVSVSRN